MFSWQLFVVIVALTLPALLASPPIKGPPIADRKDVKRIVRLGSDVKLTCPVSGFPVPMFEWFKDGEVINNYAWARFRISKKSLKITKAIMDDTGIYVCKGTNGFGTQDVRIDLIVIDPAKFPELASDEEPEVAGPVLTEETKQLRSAYRKSAGETFNLICEALAKPDAEVTWYKDQVPISATAGPYVIEYPSRGRSVLTIDQLTKADAGLFTCMARNVIGASARNFTLDVIGGDVDEVLPGDNSGVDAAGESVVDYIGHPDHPVMPNGPQNTTVEQGDKAVLECKVQSTSVPNIKWLKKLEPREYDEVKDVIDLGKDKFRVLPQQGDVQVLPDPDDSGRDEYVNKLVIMEATEADGGMYYCFVKNPVGYKFRNAYLTVVPRTIAPVGGLESSPILIVVICLAVFVLFILIGIVVCVMRKRQKQACPSSTLSESPEVRENLMRHHHMQQQQQQQQQLGLYHQQQPYMYQHLPQPNNNNLRSNLGHMNIVVNKLDQPLPAPPAAAPPPPPPSSVHSSQLPTAAQLHNLYNNRHTTSNGRPSDISGSQHSGSLGNNNVGNYTLQHQNQYEVPHVPRYGQTYNEIPYGGQYGRNAIPNHLMHY